jgi:hypothetical protein
MAQPTPFNLSRRFSQLVCRKVTFTQSTAASDAKTKQIYGIYTVLPGEAAIVVQADLRLLGSFAGSLVGLPDSVVRERLGAIPIEELLRDAIYEVLNIASSAIATEGRVVFTRMVTNPIYIESAAGAVFRKPDHRNYFNVLVEGYQGGRFSIFAPFSVGRIAAF